MKIRYANESDIKAMAEINLEGWQISYKEIVSEERLNSLSLEKFQKNILDSLKSNLCCVYENENNTILGFAIFGENRNIEKYKDYDCELHGLYIKTEYKRNGIGKKLFEFVIKELLREHKDKMMLWVLEENKSARKFYEEMGMKLIDKKEVVLGKEKLIEVSYGYTL